MNRIIHYVTLLLVISLLCGCTVDAGQSETTDAGQSGTPLPAIRRHEHQKNQTADGSSPLCGLFRTICFLFCSILLTISYQM